MYMSKIKRFFKKFGLRQLYACLAFALPALIFAGYFISKKGNILTVDLGQQYVDFLAYYQQKLFKDPSKLIYSFASGLGGSMLGTDSYYLLSPFNLLLLFFPQQFLPQGILLVISCKIGAICLSSYLVWGKKFHLAKEYVLAASLAFALCGFVVANNLNLMWLDSLVLLPWLQKAIDRLLAGEKNHLVLVTFLLWLTNFYTGYMTLLFGLLYLLVGLATNAEPKKRFWAYFKGSFFGSCLGGVSLWPTFLELLAGKTDADISWKLNFQFPPYQLTAKFIDGAYSFHEMSDGLPNIFISSCFALLALLFIFNSQFSKREKLARGLLLAFLILSLSFTPLVLIWHLGQFPVWYPARFSFLVSFYALNLALENMDREPIFNLKQKVLAALLGASVSIYLAINPNKLEFIRQDGQVATGLFLLTSLLFILFIYGQHYLAGHYALLLVVSEVTVNLIFSLNAISYQENKNYAKFEANVNQATSYLAKTDSSLYRTEKSFSRSDDDPFTGNYYGITTFNSISNSSTSNLLSRLGYVHNSNSYTNQGGTLLTDAFLGVKYYLEPNYSYDGVSAAQRMPYDNLNHRADLNSYYPIKQFKQISILKNKQALPLIFASQSGQKKVKFLDNDPAYNQQKLWESLGLSGQLFKKVKSQIKLTNLKVNQSNPLVFKKANSAKPAYVTFSLTPKNDDSYYLQLPDGFDFKTASLSVNDIFYNYESRDRQIRLVNIASQNKKSRIKVTFNLTNSTLDLTGLLFWQFNNSAFKTGIKQLKEPDLKLSQTGLQISSQTFKSQKKLWITTIPYSKNWLVYDNGKRVKTGKYAASLLAFNLKGGKHKLTLVYLPVSLIAGSLISLVTLAVYLLLKKKQRI